MSFYGLTTIARLTLLEASRRRITLAAYAGGLACVLIFALSIHFIFGSLACGQLLWCFTVCSFKC